MVIPTPSAASPGGLENLRLVERRLSYMGPRGEERDIRGSPVRPSGAGAICTASSRSVPARTNGQEREARPKWSTDIVGPVNRPAPFAGRPLRFCARAIRAAGVLDKERRPIGLVPAGRLPHD